MGPHLFKLGANAAFVFTVIVIAVSIVKASEEKEKVVLPLATPEGSNFIGEGTNELATVLLQGFVNSEKNYVFSPLGYSVILGVLSEGSRGRTRNQLVEALHLPEDTYAVRQAYKKALKKMRSCLICEDNTENVPQFKNWFYVYKNFTINESYKKILEENYLTEVRSVDRPDHETELNLDQQHISGEDGPTTGKQEEEEESVTDQEFANTEKPFAPGIDDDSVSSLSVNKISGKDNNGTERNIESKMITFNGLYYRGKWATPFHVEKGAEEENFYISEKSKKSVTMIRSEGVFQIGSLQALDCTAIELPYEGGQYSMLVLLPNTRDGLTKLIADLAGYSLSRVYLKGQFTSKPAEIHLPKFMFQTISKPEDVLRKYGIDDIFSENADLSGISADDGLFLDELVQLVTVDADETSAQTNFLSVGAVTELRSSHEKIKINHPFLFFIRDIKDNLIIAAGKVIDPTYRK